MSQFVIVDETSKAMVFGGNKSALKDAQQPAAPGIDLEQFRKLSRDMRKFIDNWDTISIDEFAHFSMRLDEMIDASPKGERVSNSDELAFAAAQEAVAWQVGDEFYPSESLAIEAIQQWGPSGAIAIPLYAAASVAAAPEGFVMVPVAEVESALDVVRGAMECAYHNRFPECCGQYSPSGCCGNPREAWSKEDQSIMDALHPAEQALAAMLAASPQEASDAR